MGDCALDGSWECTYTFYHFQFLCDHFSAGMSIPLRAGCLCWVLDAWPLATQHIKWQLIKIHENQNWIYMTATNQARRDQFVPWVSCAASARRAVSGSSSAPQALIISFRFSFVDFSKAVKLKNRIDDFLLGKYTVSCGSLFGSGLYYILFEWFRSLCVCPRCAKWNFFENIFDFTKSAHTTVFPTDYRIFARINSILVPMLSAAQKSNQERYILHAYAVMHE